MFNRRSVGFALLAMLVIGSLAISQDKTSQDKMGKDKMPATPGAMDPAMMKAWQEAATPGAPHKAMEAMAGDFKYTMKFKMDPAQPEMTAEGDYHGDMQLGGRYLFTHTTGKMMGADYEGYGAMGYDNTIQKPVAAWLDNMGTGIMRSEGTVSADNKTFTFSGEMMEPATKKMTAYKYEFAVKSNDEFSMTWWSPAMSDGKMFESMNITYTRTK